MCTVEYARFLEEGSVIEPSTKNIRIVDRLAAQLSRRMLVRGGAGAGLVAAGAVALRHSPAMAQDATPVEGGPPPLPEGATVVAEGLINPRFIAIGVDGTLYVSESGTGGDEPITEPAGGEESAASPEASEATAPAASPVADEPIGSRGFTGQVSAIAPDGTVTVVATGLPSYNVEGPTGPNGIALAADGAIILAVGGAGPVTPSVDPLPNENSVLAIDPATGDLTPISDIGAFERSDNPDGTTVDSNLYGLSISPTGTIRVADAGGNSVYNVDPATGEFTVLAVFENVPLPEGAQGPPTLQAVPTSIVENPAGGVYVGLLGGGPFPPGAAKIMAVTEDGTVTELAGGLTMVADVKIGPDGQLYACQLSTNFLAEIPAPGNVVRVLADGTQEVVVDGLMLPNGIAFDATGNLYVVVGTVSMGPPAGMILRIDGIAV